MTVSLYKRAIRLFSSPYVSKETNRANQLKWLRSVQHLGPRWVLHGGPAKWGHGDRP